VSGTEILTGDQKMRRFTGVQKFRRLFYTRSKIRTLLQETRRAEESFLKNKNSSPPDLLLALKKILLFS